MPRHPKPDPNGPHTLSLEAELNAPPRDSDVNQPWTSPLIPSLPATDLPSGSFDSESISHPTIRSYWEEVIAQREAYFPSTLDMRNILWALERSTTEIDIYPQKHSAYKIKFEEMTPLQIINTAYDKVMESKNPVSGARIEPDLRLPSIDILWIIFIIGDRPKVEGQNERGAAIHYCVPSFLYDRFQYLRLHFLVPEWNLQGHATHRLFWYGHPRYVGPGPLNSSDRALLRPQDWMDDGPRRIVEADAPASPPRYSLPRDSLPRDSPPGDNPCLDQQTSSSTLTTQQDSGGLTPLGAQQPIGPGQQPINPALLAQQDSAGLPAFPPNFPSPPHYQLRPNPSPSPSPWQPAMGELMGAGLFNDPVLLEDPIDVAEEWGLRDRDNDDHDGVE